MGKASRRKKDKRERAADHGVHDTKASSRLMELVRPHETSDSYANLIALGAMAWNLSLMPPGDEREASVLDAVTRAREIGLPLTVQWMNDLIDRKLILFPNDDRFIGTFEVVPAPGGGLTVLVAALT